MSDRVRDPAVPRKAEANRKWWRRVDRWTRRAGWRRWRHRSHSLTRPGSSSLGVPPAMGCSQPKPDVAGHQGGAHQLEEVQHGPHQPDNPPYDQPRDDNGESQSSEAKAERTASRSVEVLSGPDRWRGAGDGLDRIRPAPTGLGASRLGVGRSMAEGLADEARPRRVPVDTCRCDDTMVPHLGPHTGQGAVIAYRLGRRRPKVRHKARQVRDWRAAPKRRSAAAAGAPPMSSLPS